GFSGVHVELTMADAWFASYTQALSLVPWKSELDTLDNLGASTLDVRLETDAGMPVGSLSWRSGSVLFQSSAGTQFGADKSQAAVDWLAEALQRNPPPDLPASWRNPLERTVATGESPIDGIPAGPATSPHCATASASWMSGAWNDLQTNCYGYA